MGKQKNERRRWPQLSDDAFKKIQDLEAVVNHNDETIKLLDESVDVHKAGMIVLNNNDKTKRLVAQFGNIIDTHTSQGDNLKKFNVDAKIFLALLKQCKEAGQIKLVESLLKIVSFK